MPGFSTLDRLGIQAREKIHDVHFASIADQLDAKVRALIDNLFKVKSGETSSTWNLLKREPKKGLCQALSEKRQGAKSLNETGS